MVGTLRPKSGKFRRSRPAATAPDETKHDLMPGLMQLRRLLDDAEHVLAAQVARAVGEDARTDFDDDSLGHGLSKSIVS